MARAANAANAVKRTFIVSLCMLARARGAEARMHDDYLGCGVRQTRPVADDARTFVGCRDARAELLLGGVSSDQRGWSVGERPIVGPIDRRRDGDLSDARWRRNSVRRTRRRRSMSDDKGSYATASAEAAARRSGIVGRVRRRLFVPAMTRHRHLCRSVVMRGGRDVRVNGACVDPRRFEKRRVEPQAP